jgi:hypothetical protein
VNDEGEMGDPELKSMDKTLSGKPVSKKPFLARGSGRAGGVG